MTSVEAYASLKSLYKSMMFPKQPYAQKWTMTEIDQLDVHFFVDLLGDEEPEEVGYIDQIW